MTITSQTAHPALGRTSFARLSLANKLAVAPMTRVSATPEGVPTAEMADYYGEFADGGFGLVLTEGTYTDAAHSQAYLNQPGLVTDAQVEGWRAVVERVHGRGVPIIAQLMHAGALSQGNAFGAGTIAPSAVAPLGEKMREYGGSGPWPTPRAAETEDLMTVIDGFVTAARRADQAGFDGVEIHAANGYLLDQFITDYTNQREDEYGGDIAGRIRLVAEIASAIRAASSHLVVGVRLSQTKINDFVHRWPGGAADAEVIFEALREAGVDYLHIASEGRDFIETARFVDGRTITQVAKQVSGLPVIANGGMHDLAQAAEVLSGEHADVVSLGRGALANPDLPLRVATNTALDTFDHAILSPMATISNARGWRGTPTDS